MDRVTVSTVERLGGQESLLDSQWHILENLHDVKTLQSGVVLSRNLCDQVSE